MVATAKKRGPAKKPAVRTRVSIAVKRLAEALELPDGSSQCAAIQTLLAKVPKAKVATTAAAALAHSPGGKPVARAYLTVASGDPSAADAIVRYCAAIDRGRKAVLGAFVAAGPHASDIRAAEDAYKNLSREILDDPALLAIGVETARRLGNHRAATERTSTAERAKRLAPLVKALAGTSTARAKAKLGAASADDRRHVEHRILAAPCAYEVDLAVAALVAALDDPTVPDLSLSSAITAMRDHGLDDVVATWHRRVASGDEALILRLLALFEWTGLSASETTQLEPFVRALHPVGNRPEVLALVDGALASENPIVREAVLDRWLAHHDAQTVFSDRQIDTLMRAVVAIAEDSRDTPDRRAANHALGEAVHPGACKALMDAVASAKTMRNDKLRTRLYHGLANISHPGIAPFLVERLFVEREQHEALADAVAAKLDGAVHRDVIATLASRAADSNVFHAAALYADVLVDKRRSPRLLLGLARVVASAVPRTRDDGRRLRYVLEQAASSALALYDRDAAHAFIVQAKELPGPPYSDLWGVGRGAWTPSPLTESDVEARFAALDSGVLERELDAARKQGTPHPADDARLAALAGCAVASRLLDDRETSVVWFYDELGDLRVYDGYAVVPPTFAVAGGVTGLSDAELSIFVGGKTLVDERVTFLSVELAQIREVIRIGDRILVFDSQGGGIEHLALRVLGIKVQGFVAARNLFARFAANPPAGLRRSDPWNPKGIAIRREYRSAAGATAQIAVIHGKLDGVIASGFPAIDRLHADNAAAAKALQAWEGKLFGAGGRLVTVAMNVHR